MIKVTSLSRFALASAFLALALLAPTRAFADVQEDPTVQPDASGAVVASSAQEDACAEACSFAQGQQEGRVLEDGTYEISGVAGDSLVLGTSTTAPVAGDSLQVSARSNALAQRFQITYEQDLGHYGIATVGTGLAVGVDGTQVVLGTWTASMVQLWDIRCNDDGTFLLYSVASGLILGVSDEQGAAGAKVEMSRRVGGDEQCWNILCKPANFEGEYTISAASDASLVLDVYGASTDQNANIELYRANGGANQDFIVDVWEDGTYSLRSSGSGKFIAPCGEDDGANVSQQAASGSLAQRWNIVPVWGGLCFVNAESGLYLSAAGTVPSSGANVIACQLGSACTQVFVLAKKSAYPVMCATDFAVDVSSDKGDSSASVSRVGDGEYCIYLPSSVDLQAVSLRIEDFDGADSRVSLSGDLGYVEYYQGIPIDVTALATPVDGVYVLTVTPVNGAAATKLRIMHSANVAAVFIESDDPLNNGRAVVDASPDHSVSIEGSLFMVDESGNQVYSGGLSQVRGRGNSTWLMDKKPYQLKLSSKADLLGVDEKSKTWVLLANALDPALIRNLTALQLAEAFGLPATSSCRMVDLWFDGEYRGSYLLVEKVKVDKASVDIVDLDELNEEANPGVDLSELPVAKGTMDGYEYQYVVGVNNPADITGGYLLEQDSAYYASERAWFDTPVGHFVLKSPENASKEQVEYIMRYVLDAIQAAKSGGDAIADYFDVESLAKCYLLEELTCNTDCYWFSSTYYYKDSDFDKKGRARESRLVSGPVWDFDLSCGNQNEGDVMIGTCYGDDRIFFRYNTLFQDALKAVKDEFFALIDILTGASLGDGTLPTIAENRDALSASAAMNYDIWKMQARIHHWNRIDDAMGDFAAQCDLIAEWLEIRGAWLKSAV